MPFFFSNKITIIAFYVLQKQKQSAHILHRRRSFSKQNTTNSWCFAYLLNKITNQHILRRRRLSSEEHAQIMYLRFSISKNKTHHVVQHTSDTNIVLTYLFIYIYYIYIYTYIYIYIKIIQVSKVHAKLQNLLAANPVPLVCWSCSYRAEIPLWDEWKKWLRYPSFFFTALKSSKRYFGLPRPLQSSPEAQKKHCLRKKVRSARLH